MKRTTPEGQRRDLSETGCTMTLCPAASSTLNSPQLSPTQPPLRCSPPLHAGRGRMLLLGWAWEQRLPSPWAAKSNLWTDLQIKIERGGVLRGCLQPSELSAGVWCGCHRGGVGKGRGGCWFCRASPCGTASTPKQELSRAAGPCLCGAGLGEKESRFKLIRPVFPITTSLSNLIC